DADVRAGGAVSVIGLRKEFDGVAAVDGIDFDVRPGEFFSLLGPSGCGKTTTLRMVAGFEQPTAGRIMLDGTDLARTPAHKRPVNTVFQNYALFPHLTVAENVGYGLRWRRDVPKHARRRLVAEALELVELSSYADRKPHRVSGGQQQRVALARALVLRPSVLLLDEPLGALDAKLRKVLRGELAALQREVGITFVFVTHDQEEALEMSDRLVVMNDGQIAQTGTPREVYQEPRTEYVADFLGVANLLDVVTESGPGGEGKLILGEFPLRGQIPPGQSGPGRAVIRPERVELREAGDRSENSVPGVVERCVFLGATSQVFVRLADGSELQALLPNLTDGEHYHPGQPVSVTLPAGSLRVLARDSDALPIAAPR
ncbi:MAG: ABC transporter ATP-binding protein, partial [Dermatophilaceae bacterium]